MDIEKVKEAVVKLTGAMEAQEASAELMKSVTEDVKELGLNPTAIKYAIRRNQKRKSDKVDQVELEDDLYDFIWQENLV